MCLVVDQLLWIMAVIHNFSLKLACNYINYFIVWKEFSLALMADIFNLL